MTWGHNDKRLFVATGNEIHIGWVSSSIASLQLLSRLKIHNSLKNSDQVQLLPLPCRLQNLIGMLFTQTIRVRILYIDRSIWRTELNLLKNFPPTWLIVYATCTCVYILYVSNTLSDIDNGVLAISPYKLALFSTSNEFSISIILVVILFQWYRRGK